MTGRSHFATSPTRLGLTPRERRRRGPLSLPPEWPGLNGRPAAHLPATRPDGVWTSRCSSVSGPGGVGSGSRGEPEEPAPGPEETPIPAAPKHPRDLAPGRVSGCASSSPGLAVALSTSHCPDRASRSSERPPGGLCSLRHARWHGGPPHPWDVLQAPAHDTGRHNVSPSPPETPRLPLLSVRDDFYETECILRRLHPLWMQPPPLREQSRGHRARPQLLPAEHPSGHPAGWGEGGRPFLPGAGTEMLI